MRGDRSEAVEKATIATLDLDSYDAADIVEKLNAESSAAATDIRGGLPLKRAVEVLDEPELRRSAELVQHLPIESAVALLQALSADRAANIFRELTEPARSLLLQRVDRETRSSVEQLGA